MARPRNNSPARPVAAKRPAVSDFVAVRCPNPRCRKTYSVPAHYAGRRARCSGCSTLTQIPGGRTTAVAPTKRFEAALCENPVLPEVRVGCIGRGHAGKTALFQALGEGLVGDFLPSGLRVDAADPREVARMIKEAEQAQRLLHRSGLPPTLEVSQTRYCIYQGDEQKVVCRLREVIGQVLTHTLPDSEARLQARYKSYLRTLVNAHVLWVVVPCPPADPGPGDRRRYANDLRITTAYLREALRLRSEGGPAAVALVLSKTDALFPTAAEARAALSEDVLRRSLGPLVHLLEQSAHVADAVIVPVTAFGYGKAVRRADGTGRAGAEPEEFDEPFADEPIWLLKDGESPEPHNLEALFLWSLLLGMLNQAGGPDGDLDPELDAIGRMLRDDLETRGSWLVPVKGGVALTAA